LLRGVMAMPRKRASGDRDWRARWVAFCAVWAAIWLLLGVFFWPFWLLVPASLLAIMLPVGKPR
jgi:hypothetical protein